MGNREERRDVVVVGARCAGAATALLLARMGHQVMLLDRARQLRDTLSTHGLVRGGVVQLSRWGLLDAILDSGAPAVRQVTFRVGDDETIRPIKSRAGVDVLVAPRRHVLDPLLAQAARRAAADVRLGATVTGVHRDAAGRIRGVRGRDASGAPLNVSARFVVGADGVRSAMAGYVGAPVLTRRARDSAIFYAYARDIGAVGYELHVGSPGLAGVFPTHDGESCVWLCSRRSVVESVLRAGPARPIALIDAIGTVSPTLGERLRRGAVTSAVRGTIELPNHVRQPVGPGWALVGDAGCHRDPITGHGITDALRDAELLARCLDGALRGEATDTDALDAYQHQRDAALREVFDLTCALAAYPAPTRFVALQRQLSDALEVEADALAAQPSVPGRPAVRAA
jgi:flavin-dependent dehydrogenase